jgi:hypothetical protein
MIKTKSKSVISSLRKSIWSKFCLFLLITNFINLSANFYEGNILISNKIKMMDPIDTLTELIFEWALEGADDLIPDNGTQQDDNSLEKMKLALLEIPGFRLSPVLMIEDTLYFSMDENLMSGYFSSDSPPPDRC